MDMEMVEVVVLIVFLNNNNSVIGKEDL
ncbi:hypothetical protein Mgra_00005777, partial [Meloidogyne graminicola]